MLPFFQHVCYINTGGIITMEVKCDCKCQRNQASNTYDINSSLQD